MSKKTKKILYNVILVLLSCVFLGCAAYLGIYFYHSRQSEAQFSKLEDLIDDSDSGEYEHSYVATEGDAHPGVVFVEVNKVYVQKRLAKLFEKNTDFRGWLSIEDTAINYPVMQTMEDEEFYIHRDFEKEYSEAGTLFADTSSSIERPSDNILIYGHNMKTGKMFHDLLKYEDEDFYNNHKYIQFDTIYGNGTYEVIAAFRTQILPEDATDFKYYEFFQAGDEQEFSEYVSNCKAMTPYKIEQTATYGDELITLSTCAYHTENGRFAVVAKKIR